MGILARKIEIGPDTILQRNKEILFNEVNGEVVMLSVENGEYYGMDKVGSKIWHLLQYPITYKQLISNLLTEYDVSEEKCFVETLNFLAKLKDEKLIQIRSGK